MSFKKILKIAAGVLAAVIIAFVFTVSRHYQVPILMYHSVYPGAKPQNRLAVNADSFRRQVCFLKKHNYNVIPLEKLADLIREKKKIPRNTVLITFDDGYRDFYLYAYSVLKEYNLPATMFVIINEVGRPQQDRLSWNEIKEMQDSGLITFGSHCLGPEPLINLKFEAEVKREIIESKSRLQEKLGREVVLFSYPEGRFSVKIRQMVIDAGYKAAVATNPGIDYPGDDVFALKRLRISSTSDNLFVFWFESNGYYTFFRERRHK